MKRCLLDTGPLVAFFDSGEIDHARVVQALAAFKGELLTTGAVVTEAFHFMGPDRRGIAALVEFLQQAGIRLLDCFTAEALSHVGAQMRKYSDLPMDFADATLVWAAEQSHTDDILTLDERGFRTYRHGRNRTFHLLLQDRARKS